MPFAEHAPLPSLPPTPDKSRIMKRAKKAHLALSKEYTSIIVRAISARFENLRAFRASRMRAMTGDHP